MRANVTILALAATVSAQSASSAASSITSSAASASATGGSSTIATNSTSGPATHTIDVGKGGNTFSPDVTQAEVGDVIQFNFYPTNHTVIRADYGYPCVPYEMILGAGYTGFWSGWEPVDAVLDEPPTWSVTVNDTDPIFYYCGAPGSCISYGMVGVINPNASTSLSKQRQLAEASTFALVPGEDWPSEADIPSGVATASTATATSTAPATVTATPSSAPSHSGLGAGAIAGIAIGGAAVLLAAGVAVWFCGRQSRRQQAPAPGAPAQEVGYVPHPHTGSMYGKPGHMSTVSGYTMPPGYDHSMTHTPVDPMMGQMMHSGAPSPNFQPVSPAVQQNMYAPGVHNVAPVEMEGASNSAAVPRRSTEKSGVERYS